jgi:hypothetical protein
VSGVWSLRGQPFRVTSLLIFRTDRIVTAISASSVGYPDFPAYSQMRTALSPTRGATNYLRTVPVCYYRKRGGWLISDHLSRSPVRADYLISVQDGTELGV